MPRASLCSTRCNAITYAAEAAGNPLHVAAGLDPAGGNMEGEEVRHRIALSALWAVATTGASNGSVNAMLDSFTPLGGLVPMFLIQLGEVLPGGVGSGLCGVFVFVLLAVFVAGLMVGRTPEYLGKKIQARKVKLAMLTVLVVPFCILGFSAVGAVLPVRSPACRRPGRTGYRSCSTPIHPRRGTMAQPSAGSWPTRPG